MSKESSNSTQIESRNQLLEFFQGGEKPKKAWRIGTEHEKIPFQLSTHAPVDYYGANGIQALLTAMRANPDWLGVYENGNIIALESATNKGSITLEPGGQFELSGRPLPTIHHICAEINRHLKEVHKSAIPLNIGFLGLGTSPVWTMDQIPRMPKRRYQFMERYMPTVGTTGLEIMFRTATVQVNLDFASEADMVKKMRVSLALQPVATALFANSPFLDGKPTGLLSSRSAAWLDTDKMRTGMLPFAFEQGFGYEQYVDYALDAPIYFILLDGEMVDANGVTFRAYMNDHTKIEGVGPATLGDWETHLGTLFPEVRLKKFIEMRGADAGPWRDLCSLPAFWVGLIYDEQSLDQAWELVKDWTSEERWNLRVDATKTALKTNFRGAPLSKIAGQVVEIAQAGLARRARLNRYGDDETDFLTPLQETLGFGLTPAERLLRLYHGSWQRDIERIFADYAY